MITTIFFVVLFAVIGFIIEDTDGFAKVLNGLLGSIVGLIFGFSISLALPAKTEIITNKYQIVSIENDTTGFVIGKTDHKSNNYYVCFCIIDGDTIVKHVPVEDIKIEYVNKNDTTMVEKEVERMVDGAFINKIATDMIVEKYTLYLPKQYSQTIFDFEL